MKLKPDCEKEYKKRHDEIWPGNEAYGGEGNHQLSVADVDLYYDYSYQAPFLYFYTRSGISVRDCLGKMWPTINRHIPASISATI